MPEFEVIAGDMFDEIGRVEPASCRCALIDPPYMIGTQSVHRDNMIDPWADLMNGARFYREVIDAVRPKLTKDGAMWLFMNWRGLPAIYKASCDAKWLPASCMVWSKDWPGTGDPLRASHELCLLYTCEGFKRPNAKTLDVQTCKPVPTAHRVHSAQKPVSLLRMMLEFTTARGDTVLDCFCGSGSTGVAAVSLGRRFVGIEANAAIAEVARRRIEAEASQGQLFVSVGGAGRWLKRLCRRFGGR